MIKKKTKPKRYLQLLDDKCPKCGQKLAVWTRHSDGGKFIGCSSFPDPHCKYIKRKSDVDFIRDELRIPIEWRPNITNKLIEIFSECQSSKEKLYLLGAIYYLDTDSFNYEHVIYKNKAYYGLVFNRVYQYLKMGGYSPTSLAVVSQVGFGNNYHHDFGIFFSDEKFPNKDDWWLGLAVEIDYHPKHKLEPNIDKYRDSLVKYKVLRLKEGNEPQNWFRHVEFTFNAYVENTFEDIKEEN
jgi:ssDNA-binding Zn-finger/Zn-ribbon topoisomerase 1